MKCNLETIKKALEKHYENQNMFTFDDLQTEIQGLEKELRKKLVEANGSPYGFRHRTSTAIMLSKLIKEILGK